MSKADRWRVTQDIDFLGWKAGDLIVQRDGYFTLHRGVAQDEYLVLAALDAAAVTLLPSAPPTAQTPASSSAPATSRVLHLRLPERRQG